ncbi:unnamed protein product [Rotaria sordida]|uniref:Uncharacterized protein n=1 Tax=Rotaria sordida TaxID=392033 RepID=A0A816G2Z5_9BILA|nr:unnamed protein product [Rotaria sordida]CAF1669542.1 unnamed protein product [Rotaria sordida]
MDDLPSKFHMENNHIFPKFTFAELAKENITSYQLYLWSAPIDVAERYQLYLNQMSISNNRSLEREIYYNCTLPRFGSLCQYEINYVHENYSSLYDMINNYYEERYFNPDVNCYTHLQCNRGPSPACLDWTEICDGQVDCIDDKVDEKDCWKIEIHVCQDDEFQCSNGQCIPMAFYRDDETSEDCADMTDERSPQVTESLRFIYKQPSFINEEIKFRPLPIGNLNFDLTCIIVSTLQNVSQ